MSRLIAIIIIALVISACKASTPTEAPSAANANRDLTSQSADEKYGLSEAKRRQISEEFYQLLIQASSLASNKYPFVRPGEPFDGKAMRERAKKCKKMEEELMEQRLADLEKKYDLSRKQLLDIQDEGIEKKWTAYPKPPIQYR